MSPDPGCTRIHAGEGFTETQKMLARAMGRPMEDEPKPAKPQPEPPKVVRLSAETLAAVREKAAAGCPICRCALAAMDPHTNTLRNWPLGTEESGCPAEAQAFHIRGERGAGAK